MTSTCPLCTNIARKIDGSILVSIHATKLQNSAKIIQHIISSNDIVTSEKLYFWDLPSESPCDGGFHDLENSMGSFCCTAYIHFK